MPTLAYNKRAKYDYEITDTFEAGLVLLGHEVKSIKTGHISLKGAFVTPRKIRNGPGRVPELYLINAHIPKYAKASTVKDYNPDRSRKLLLKKRQVEHLIGKRREQGLTLVPIKIYTKHSLIKLEFGLGKGKRKYDKREAIKKREADRKLRILTKTNYK